MTAAWNVYMKHFLCMMFVMGCLCIPVEMNAQSCNLRFNMDGVKLQNPTEKRLNDKRALKKSFNKTSV